MPRSKIFWIIPFLVLFIGIFIGQKLDLLLGNNPNNSDIQKINEVYEYAKNYYYKDFDSDELVENAITGMLDKLDPHSVYIPPQDQVGIAEQFKGKFDGIGVEYQIIDDSITVVSAISGGPSESVGILPGDRIIEIDKKDAIGYTNKEVVLTLRGKKGTSVDIKIFRPFLKKELNFSIIRDQIPLNTVEAALMISDSIAYVALSKFVQTSFSEMKNVLLQLEVLGMKSLILDLRNNPGGYMDQAVKIADLFIDGEKMIVYTKGKRSDLDDEHKAINTYSFEQTNLAVLLNKGSASASEILSGAIQDWDRGIIVGETSFGKGLVQRPFLLPDNSAVRITIAKYYTPSGREIQRDYENGEDYYGAVYSRDEKEGDNSDHSQEIDSLDIVYKTNAGRKIKANGGITPDFIVKNDELTYYSILLRSKDLYYKFIRKYLDDNGTELLKRYNGNLVNFRNNFSFSKNEINSFIKFAATNKVEFVKEEYEKDKDYINLRLKAHIGRNYWKSEGWYSILLNSDNQYLKAKELLENKFKVVIN